MLNYILYLLLFCSMKYGVSLTHDVSKLDCTNVSEDYYNHRKDKWKIAIRSVDHNK